MFLYGRYMKTNIAYQIAKHWLRKVMENKKELVDERLEIGANADIELQQVFVCSARILQCNLTCRYLLLANFSRAVFHIVRLFSNRNLFG